jgi:hypothetical protein
LSVSLELDVSFITPGGIPGVLDEPVVDSIFSSITNKEDTVVKAITAFAVIGGEDSTLVELEAELVGFNGNRDGLLSNSLQKSLVRFGLDIRVSSDIRLNLTLVILASTNLTLVGVVSFLLTTGIFKIFESEIHKTTIATVVEGKTLVAIDELLLGEREEFSVGDLESTLNSSGGGERPA